MGLLPLNLEQLQEHLGELLAELLLGAQLTPAMDNPAPVVSAFGQLFEAMNRLDDAAPQPSPTATKIATSLGQSAYRLLGWANHLLDTNAPVNDTPNESQRGDRWAVLHIGFAYWTARHGGTPANLVALVDDLARLDGLDVPERYDPAELVTIMLAVIDSMSPTYAASSHDPCDPWRLLHLLLCATAQRAQRDDLMQQTQTRLLSNFPDDAARCGHIGTDATRRSRDTQDWRNTPRDVTHRAHAKSTLH